MMCQTLNTLNPNSGTTYEFLGRGYIQYKSSGEGKLRISKTDIAKTMKKISKF
jgi:predicted site-specific integrase-resolvase